MAEELVRLTREIERIITAPYVPSLQDLYHLVNCLNSSKIKIWALQKPCQVGLLADLLVESLSRSRVALPLLSEFSKTACFRDALLNRHPVVLDALLEKAMDADGESEYTLACVDILSSPLPSTMVLPGRLASFVAKLVSAMSSHPCAQTVAPLHSLMNMLSSSSQLFNEISDDIMSELQLELTKTLRNMEDHMGILTSLATFARIVSTQANSQTSQQKHGSKPPAWLLNIQHFFSPKRGQKTLDLVVLRVILACSPSSSPLSPSQAAESIRLAISIIDTIDLSQKNAWVASGSSKIAKLCDKVIRDGLDREVQLTGLTCLLSICPVANLPPQIRNLGLRLLVSRDSRAALTTMDSHLVIRLTQYLAACDESIVYELLRFTVDAVRDNNMNCDTFSNIHVADLLLSSFQQSESEQVISSLLSSASTKETIASLFGQFPAKCSKVQCDGSEICYCAYNEMQNKILRNLFEMYFAATLSQTGYNRDIDNIKSFVRRVPLTLEVCSFANSEPQNFRSSFSLRDKRESSSLQLPNRDWRSQFTHAFMQTSEMAHSRMMKQVEDACFDMERRCCDVEGPLRSVEEDLSKRTQELEQLKQENEMLQLNNGQSAQVISDLRQENIRAEEQAESAAHRLDELNVSLNSAHEELHEQMRISEENLNIEKQRSRTRELDLMAASTEKDDQLEELQAELHRSQLENEKLRQSLNAEAIDKTSFSETVAVLQRDVEESKKLLEQSRFICSQKDDEIRSLVTDNENSKMETENVKSMMQQQKVEIEGLQNALQQAEVTAKSDVALMEQRHAAEMSDSAAKVAKLNDDSVRMQKDMEDAASEASKKLQAKEKRMQQLEKKVQAMRDEREAKAREFSEAQQHIGRLMGVMGFSAQPTESKSQHPTKGVKQPPGDTRNNDAYHDEDSQLIESFESMAANLNEPTPKRPRGNRNSRQQQPVPRTPGFSASKSSSKVSPDQAPRSTRQPLAETDLNGPNKSPSGDGLKQNQPTVRSSDDFEGNCLQDLALDMDLEFSRDFLFTSTASQK